MEEYIGYKDIKYDGMDHLTGKTVFLDDWALPGTLCAGVKKSELAHGRLISINIEQARIVPGVRAVLTSKDVPQNRYGVINDQYVLAEDFVRYRGQPIVAVAGESPEAVQEALSLIKVEYEELPANFDPLKSLEGKTLVHEIKNFVNYGKFNCRRIRNGDVQQGFKEADFIFENCYQTQVVEHAALETQAAIAVPEADGILTIYTNSQHFSFSRGEVAHVLRRPLNGIRVRGGVAGGAFGSKGKQSVEQIVSVLAILTGRPVKWVWTREEEFEISLTRAPHFMVYKTGVTRSGRIMARSIISIRDIGAFGYDHNIGITKHAMFSRGPYNIPHFSFDGYVVFTNRTPSAGMRGYGGPQAHFAGESQIDEIAREMHWDPVEFRMKNIVTEGDRHISGQRLQGVGIKDCISAVKERMDSDKKPRPVYGEEWRQGQGFAVAQLNTGYTCMPAMSITNVFLEPDGQIVVLTNAVEIGQGIRTVCARLASDSLSVPIQQVRITGGDSSLAPYCDGAGASQCTYLVGNSVVKACLELKKKILEESSLILEVDKDKLNIQEGYIYESSKATALISLEQLGRLLFSNKAKILSATGTHRLSVGPLDEETGEGVPYEAYSYAAAGVQLAVDRLTGKVKIEKVYVAVDAGKAINPLMVNGQMYGGLAMDMGYALSENLYPNYPRSLSPSVQGFHDYPMMTFADMPEVACDIVEAAAAGGPGGAKGMGEIVATVHSAAIANAIFDAIGIRFRKLPITSEAILRALQSKEEPKVSAHEIYAAVRKLEG